MRRERRRTLLQRKLPCCRKAGPASQPQPQPCSQQTPLPQDPPLSSPPRAYLVPQAHHKLGNLLDVDHILGLLGVGADDLGAAGNLQ